jgi:adenosylhomocysteinase
LHEAAKLSDFILTVTGDKHVIDETHLQVMKDGCVIANAGHFNVEINIPALEAMSREKHKPRVGVEEYLLQDGRVIRLLAEGRLVNLAAAEGHPSAVMDMSFANQVLSIIHMVENRGKLENTVHNVPAEIDQEIAGLKLAAMGIEIDELTDAQRGYLSSWREGT